MADAATVSAALKVKGAGEFKRAMGEAQSSVSGLSQATIKNARLAGAALSAIGGSAIALGAMAFGAAKDVEEAMATIRSGTGATGADMDKLGATFREVVKNVPTDFGTAASTIADLNTMLGLTGDQLTRTSMMAIEAGNALDTDVSKIIDSTTKAMNAFNVSGDKAGDILDQMFVASQQTGIPIDKLAVDLQSYGPVLSNLGFSLTETTALFGNLNKVGVDVSRVMPGINAFMRNLAKEGVTDLRGALSGVISQMENAGNKTEALNIATEAFGAEGAQRLVVAVREGAFNLDEMTKSLMDSKGAILSNAEATRTFSEKWGLVKTNVSLALAPLGDQLIVAMEALMPLLTKAGNVLAFLIDKFVNLPGPVQAVIGIILAAAAVIGPILILLPMLAGGIAIVTGAFAGLSIAMWPVTLTILAIAGAIALGILIWRNWETIIDSIRGMLKTFDRATGGMLTKLGLMNEETDSTGKSTNKWIDLLKTLSPILILLAPILTPIILAWRNWDKIVNVLRTSLEKIRDFGDAVVDIVVNFLGSIPEWWESIKTFFGKIWSISIKAIGDFFTTTLPSWWESIKGFFGKIWSISITAIGGFFTTTLPAWWESIKGFFSKLWTISIAALGNFFTETIPGWWASIRNFVGGAFTTTINFIGSLLGIVGRFFSSAGDTIERGIDTNIHFFGSLGGFLVRFFGTAGQALNRTIATGINFAFGFATGIIRQFFNFTTGGAIIRSVRANIDFFMGAISQVGRWAALVVNIVIGAINDILPRFIPRIPTIPVPSRALGGIVHGGPVLVGERGPEIVSPPGGSRVIPNSALGGGGGGTLVVNYHQNAPIYGILDFRREIEQIIRDAAGAGKFHGVLQTL